MAERVYVSGPMRGLPGFIVRFLDASECLRACGHFVVNPHEINAAWAPAMEARGLTLTGPDYMRRDIVELMNCSAIHLLEGWDGSVGARCEAAIAMVLGLTFVDKFGEPIEAPARVIIGAGGYNDPPGRVHSLDDLRLESIEFANRTFGRGFLRRPAILAHMKREIKEIEDDLETGRFDPIEAADIFLLLAHLTDQVDDFPEVVARKLARNKARTWGEPDAEGVIQHTSEGVAP